MSFEDRVAHLERLLCEFEDSSEIPTLRQVQRLVDETPAPDKVCASIEVARLRRKVAILEVDLDRLMTAVRYMSYAIDGVEFVGNGRTFDVNIDTRKLRKKPADATRSDP